MTIFDPTVLRRQVASTKVTHTWTFTDPKLITRDDFKDVAGNKDGPDPSVHT